MKKKRAGLTSSVLAPAKGQIKPLESFIKHVQAAIDDHCSVNQIWSRLASVAPSFETEHYSIADYEMERWGILRDVSSVDWSIGCLSRLCADVAIPASGLDTSVAHGPEPDEMTDSWLIVRKNHSEAAGLMMQGRLGTGIQMVMAADPEAVFDLAYIVAFNALDSAYRAAQDARGRLRDPLKLDIHALATNKVPRNGALAQNLREAWKRASEVHTIFRNSGPVASQQDSELVGALRLNDRAVAQRHGMAPSDSELIGLLAVLLKEGQAETDHIVQSLDGRRTKQWSLQEVHRWLHTPAIPLLWNSVLRAAQVHSAVRRVDVGAGIQDEAKRFRSGDEISWAEQIVRDTAQGNPPRDLMPNGFMLPAELPRLLCHRLRIDVVQDEDAIPKKFSDAAAREQAAGNTDACWQEPYTFEKVVEGLGREGKNHGSRFL
ncbi:hypothetical protein, partial [Sphingomonas koreensis]